MTHKAFALASALLLSSVAPASAKPPPDPIDMGASPEGQISVDAANVLVRGGQRTGWKQIEATIQLDKPVLYAAREITQEVQTQEWDCPGARYRIVMRVFRANDGGFVRSERKVPVWMSVPKQGPQRATFDLLCPKATEEDGG